MLEIVILLVAEGLNGRGVEDPLSSSESTSAQVLTDEGLSGPCLGTDKHVVAGMDAHDRVLLKRVQLVLGGQS